MSWLRVSHQESRWLAFVAVAAAIGLQVVLPERLSLGPRWLLPSVEAALAVGLIVANPNQVRRDTRLVRQASLLLVAVMSIANGVSAALLLQSLLQGRLPGGAATG